MMYKITATVTSGYRTMLMLYYILYINIQIPTKEKQKKMSIFARNISAFLVVP